MACNWPNVAACGALCYFLLGMCMQRWLLVGNGQGKYACLYVDIRSAGVDSQMTRRAMRKAAVRSSTSCIRTTRG